MAIFVNQKLFDSTLFLDKIRRRFRSDDFDYSVEYMKINVPAGTGSVVHNINLSQDLALIVTENMPAGTIVESPISTEIKPSQIADQNFSDNRLNLDIHQGYINFTIEKDSVLDKIYTLQIIRVTKN